MSHTDEDYRERCRRILDGVEYGPKPVLTITEAEILALDDPDKQRVTPLLSLGPPVSDHQRQLAADEAARRLFDIGRTEDGTLVGGPGSDAEEPTVRTVLRMRRSWLGVLMVDQRTALGRQFLTAYLRADRRAMTEFVTSDGRHQFTVMKRAVALDAATELLTPFPDAADADGPGQSYARDSWQDEVKQMLTTAKIATSVISRRQDRAMATRADDRLTVYNLDDRSEVLTAESADRVRIAPVSRRTLRTRLEEITSPLDGAEPQ